MKKLILILTMIMSSSVFAVGGSTTVYGNTRYCIPSAGGQAQGCGNIVNGSAVQCDNPPSTNCTIPGVGSGSVSSKKSAPELIKR